MGKLFCDEYTNTQDLCVNAFFTVVGFNNDQLNRTIIPDLLQHFPAGVSWKQIVHYGQLIMSKRFQLYDYYDKSKNLEVYGTSTPPQYDLDNVEIPMTLYYGTSDSLLVPNDAERCAKKLSRYVYRVTRIQGWNHADFFMAIDANKMVYKSLLSDMKLALSGGSNIDTIRALTDDDLLPK